MRDGSAAVADGYGATFDGEARAALRAFVGSPEYSCLGARAALRSGRFEIETYARLDDAAVTCELARDLGEFDEARRAAGAAPFATFVAVFAAGGGPDSVGFERALWSQL